MVDVIPQWLAVARRYLGVEEVGGRGDNPTILKFATTVAAKFPRHANYAALYVSDDTAWCGVAAADWFAEVGIEPPFGPRDTDKWMWADAWMPWGVPSGPREGAVVCFGGHVALVNRLIDADTFEAIGGNQSSPQGGAVTLSRRRWSDVKATRWPDAAGAVVVPQPVPGERPEIKRGSTGPAVIELQRLLGVPQNGTFWLDTDASVRAYQAAHGLDVDGEVGPLTWAALLGNAPAIEQPANMQTSKGSWYSQYDGKYHWRDSGDAPGSAALGVPDDAQGVAMPSRTVLGNWYAVRAPNGKVSIEQVTDLGPAAWTGRTIDIAAAAAERLGYSPQNFPTDSIFTFWAVPVPREVAWLSRQNQAIQYRDIRKGLPVEGDVLPPSIDNDLLIALIFLLSEGNTMDATLRAAMIAELSKPAPNLRALLLQALGATGTNIPPVVVPPVVTPLPAPAFDPTPYMPLLQNPIVQKMMANVTMAELFSLIPSIVAISQGKPIVQLPGPVTPPVVTPPVVVTPPIPPGSNHALNWSTAIAAAIGALGLSGAGLTGSPIPGDPSFSMTGLLSLIGPFLGAGAAPWVMPLLGGLFGKK